MSVDILNTKYVSYVNDLLLGTTVGRVAPTGSFCVVIGKNIPSFSGQRNNVIGYSAGNSLLTGQANVLIGSGANVTNGAVSSGVAIGYNSTTASNSVSVGNTASASGIQSVCVGANVFSTQSNVVAVGSGSSVIGLRGTVLGVNSSVTGNDALAIGYQSLGTLQSVAIGSNSNAAFSNVIAVGYSTQSSNSGSNSVILGSNSGNSALSSNNVLIGYSSGTTTISASNTFIGSTSGLNNTSGAENVCIGNKAGTANTTTGAIAIGGTANLGVGATGNGQYSVAIGYQTLAYGSGEIYIAPLANSGTLPTGGSNNVYIGYQENFSMSTGSDNLVIGGRAGENISTGQRNTVIGTNVNALSTGSDNILMYSGASMTTANNYVGIGNVSLNTVVLGSGTQGGVAIGTQSLQSATDAAGGCTALGYQAGTGVTSGAFNTCIGNLCAGAGNLTTGSNNTCLGYNTQIPATLNNCTAVGNGASNFTASNQINLGNGSITQIRANVAVITFSSDIRDKKEIEPLNIGIEFIRKLEPVEFIWNKRDKSKINIPEIGFIAQDLLNVQKNSNIFIPNLVDDTDSENLMAAYGTLIPVIVQGTQDISGKLDKLETSISKIKQFLIC